MISKKARVYFVGQAEPLELAFWLWLEHEIASLGAGYIEFTPNKPRLIAISPLTFTTAFFWQYHRSRKG